MLDEIHLQHENDLKPTAGDKKATAPDPQCDQNFTRTNHDGEDTRVAMSEDGRDNFLMARNATHDLAEETVRKPNKPNQKSQRPLHRELIEDSPDPVNSNFQK